MERNYAIIGVEGNHDQAFVKRVLELLNFKSFNGNSNNLDPFWEKFIPTYPNQKDLYKRLDMPSILFTDNLSVAIYVGEGSGLAKNLQARMYSHPPYKNDIIALGIIADADKKSPSEITQFYFDNFKGIFPNFPNQPGYIDNSSSPATGIYVLPDNANIGVLETILKECGDIIYPEYMKRSISYLSEFSEEERKTQLLSLKLSN